MAPPSGRLLACCTRLEFSGKERTVVITVDPITALGQACWLNERIQGSSEAYNAIDGTACATNFDGNSSQRCSAPPGSTRSTRAGGKDAARNPKPSTSQEPRTRAL